MLQNPSEGAVYSGILTKGVNMLRNKASCFYKKGGQHPPEWQLLFLAFNHALGGSAWAGISRRKVSQSAAVMVITAPAFFICRKFFANSGNFFPYSLFLFWCHSSLVFNTLVAYVPVSRVAKGILPQKTKNSAKSIVNP
jgi:hypothetical protein